MLQKLKLMCILAHPDDELLGTGGILAYRALQDMPDEFHRKLWGTQTLCRVLSLVNGGRALEDDLFVGLRVNEYEDTSHEVPCYQ